MLSQLQERTVKERNFGVDALKVLSMFCIVVLHMSMHGGIMRGMATASVKYTVMWLMYAFTGCAVNSYALISGYVGVTTGEKPGRMLTYWLQVVFYSLGIALLFWIILPEKVTLKQTLSYLFPITNYVYWYFTAYICVMVCAPMFNAALNGLSERTLKNMLIFGFGLFVVLPMLMNRDLYNLKNGESAFWLGYLYMMGGYIRLHGRTSKWRLRVRSVSLIVFVVCVLVAWGWKVYFERSIVDLPYGFYPEMLIKNTSPMLLIASLCLFVYFEGVTLNAKVNWICARLSALTFGVYLIHDHPLVREYLVRDNLAWMVDAFDFKTLPFIVLGFSLAVFSVSLFVEWLRSCVFDVLKIRQRCFALMHAVTRQSTDDGT